MKLAQKLSKIRLKRYFQNIKNVAFKIGARYHISADIFCVKVSDFIHCLDLFAYSESFSVLHLQSSGKVTASQIKNYSNIQTFKQT